VIPRLRTSAVAVATLSVVGLGCAADDPATSDPDGLEEPADAPEGAPEDGVGETEAEDGTGEPAVEGDSEGQFDPEDE
jgi:hypothetical protein